MMARKIYISEKHLKEGIAMSCFDCPVALAVNEHLDFTKYRSEITPREIQIYDRNNNLMMWQKNTNEVEEKIRAIDCNNDIQPFWISLEIPERLKHLFIDPETVGQL